jgi:hypothetical protein
MKPPRILLGAALVFWGWQTGLLWLGAAAALAVEGAHAVTARWEFSQADLDRIWNLCVAMFLGATIYAFASSDNFTVLSGLLRENSSFHRLATLNEGKRSLFQLLQWLPAMFLPIALAEAYHAKPTMDFSTFSWWLRRRRDLPAIRYRYLASGVTVGYPFFACCLFSASANNQRSWGFTGGLVVLIVWALVVQRCRSFRLGSWASHLTAALALAVALQFGMFELQKLMQRLDEALIAQWTSARAFDATETQTRIGVIGRLKLSGRILFRVDAHGQAPPALLHQASYNQFKATCWNASKREFAQLAPESDQASWLLQHVRGPMHRATIAGALPGGSGTLPLPHSVVRVKELPAVSLATNALGTVRIEDAPGFLEFEAAYGGGHSIDGPSVEEDSAQPDDPAVLEIARRLKLAELEPEAAVRAVEDFFRSNFKYSLWQPQSAREDHRYTALGRFLMETRSGHCEYFATATVLLLRAAGIPARYATGFSVQEKQGDYFVVRERHAHAWCLACLRGEWREVDTTPSNWASIEASQRSTWQGIQDFVSRIWFEFSRWRWGHAEWKRYLLWLIAPLLAIALARLLLNKQWRRAEQIADSGGAEAARPGQDSEFYRIEEKLRQAGFSRARGETATAWLARLARSGTAPVRSLPELLAWHYRLRFDPRGLPEAERAQLRARAKTWLEQHSASTRG